ncbi:hypothetical protein ACG7TL_003970 [Trametes sanguinea]
MYCSRDHQIKDLLRHRSQCGRETSGSASSPSTPETRTVSVIVFPVDAPSPRITRLGYLVREDPKNSGEEFHIINFRSILHAPRTTAFPIGGTESTTPPSRLYIAFDASLDESDSSSNRCVQALTRGQSKRRWWGQLIGYRAREEADRDLTQFVDVSQEDVRKFTEYFKHGGDPPFAVQWNQSNRFEAMLRAAMMMEAMMASARSSQAQDSQRFGEVTEEEESEGPSPAIRHHGAAAEPEASQQPRTSREDLEKVVSDVRVAITEGFAQERVAIREIVATETKNAMLVVVGVAFAAYAGWCLLVLPLVALLDAILAGIRVLFMAIVHALIAANVALAGMCWRGFMSLLSK